MLLILKIGGLLFSAMLTFSFFTRLFGLDPRGLAIATASLALYEGGAYAWSELLKKARHGQRTVARVCLALTVGLSVFSSAAEIVLATKLASDSLRGLDLEFISLIAAATALAVNFIGAIAYEAETPETKAKAQRMEQQARLASMKAKQQDAALDAAEAESLVLIEAQAPQFGAMLAQSAIGNTAREVARLSRADDVIDASYTMQPSQALPNAPQPAMGFAATAAPPPNVSAYEDDSRYFDDTAAQPHAQPQTPTNTPQEDNAADNPKAPRPQRKTRAL